MAAAWSSWRFCGSSTERGASSTILRSMCELVPLSGGMCGLVYLPPLVDAMNIGRWRGVGVTGGRRRQQFFAFWKQLPLQLPYLWRPPLVHPGGTFVEWQAP